MNQSRKKNRSAILRIELTEAESLVRRYEKEARRLAKRISQGNGKTSRGMRERCGQLQDTLLPQARQALAAAKEQVAST